MTRDTLANLLPHTLTRIPHQGCDVLFELLLSVCKREVV